MAEQQELSHRDGQESLESNPPKPSPPNKKEEEEEANFQLSRKAGMVHIRGMIRRVWRPRYLVCCGDGTVRYYEQVQSSSPSCSSSSLGHNRITSRGDLTMTSDLDGSDNSTTEDSVICGGHTSSNSLTANWSEITPISNSNSNSNLNINTSTLPPSNLRLKATLTITSSTLLPPQKYTQIGLPPNVTGFMFKATIESSHPNPTTNDHFSAFYSDHPSHPFHSRDYFCATDTLSEARSWVSALGYAAKKMEGVCLLPHVGMHMQQTTQVTEEYCCGPYSPRGAWEEREEDVLCGEEMRRIYDGSKEEKKDGTVILTQVTGYRVNLQKKREEYQIKMLLLRTGSDRAEERVFHKSEGDFRKCVTNLKKMNGRKKWGNAGEVLREAEIELYSSNRRITSYTGWLFPKHYVTAKIRKYDNALRALTANGSLCNSPPMKEFLILLTGRNNKSKTATNSNTKVHKITVRKLENEPDDAFVKRWLLHSSSSSRVTTWECVKIIISQFLMCNQIYVELSLCIGLGLCMGRLGSVISLHLDSFLFIIFMVFVLGWKIGGRQQLRANQQQQNALSKSHSSLKKKKDKGRKPISTSSTSDEEYHQQQQDHPADHSTDQNRLSSPRLPSPLPKHNPDSPSKSTWADPPSSIFHIRSSTYLHDRIKVPSAPAIFPCRGVDMYLTQNPMLNIARHPSLLGGTLLQSDTFLVNFLLPFGNFVAYFSMPPMKSMPPHVRLVWNDFKKGDQSHRDARFKLLPVVVDGPWIVKKAVGPGNAPALLGKVIPLQYHYHCDQKREIFEVDVIITASRIAKAILNVVKGHTEVLSIAFAFIIEGCKEEELPECVLCCFQMQEVEIDKCPFLPEWQEEGGEEE